jgi:hypothetical protein
MVNLHEPPSELEQLLRSDSDEPIIVNPGPSSPPGKRRVTFAPNQPIFNESKYHRLTIEHINANKISYYTTDLFHTLINVSNVV